MSVPNRSAEVAAMCGAHPEAFPPGEQNDPARFHFLTTIVIPSLNMLDNGNWGVMTKTEQKNRVPVDIIMWRPTNEFVDCLTGTGPMWQEFPPAPVEWVWTPVEGSVGPGQVLYQEDQVIAFQDDLRKEYEKRGRTFDMGSCIWSARVTWDSRELGWTKAREKHLASAIATLDS